MPAVFSYDAQTGPQHVDLNGIAAGYGVISVPVTGFLPGDVVQAVGLSIAGTNLTPIAIAVDMVQRTGGYYEWTDTDSISAHFTITQAQIAQIAAATNVTYQVTITVLRNGVQQLREVQDGKLSARPLAPTPPLVVNSIVLTGGPVSGAIGGQAQLSATCYDGFGNALPSATVTWTSGNPNIASVDASGKVTFLIPGTATITASAQGVAQSTTATVSDPGLVGATANQVVAWDNAQSNWLPKTLTAAFLSITAGALIVGGGWPAGATELAPGAAAGYVRSNGSAWVRQAGIPAADINAGTLGAGAYTFPSSVSVSNGLSVLAGTSALQALTATTGVFSSTVSAAGFSGPLTGNASSATALATARTIAITGDLAWTSPAFDGSGNVTAIGTLATVNASPGSFGGASQTLTVTVNGKGLVTAVSASTLVAPAGTLSGTTLASNVVASSLTSLGALTSLTVAGTTALQSALVVNGTTTLNATLSIVAGGLTVSSGTSAFQALTATSAALTGPLTVTSASSQSVVVGANGGTNPVWQVDSSTASQAAGLKLTGATASGTVALGVISSGANANLSIDALGTGSVTINGTATGTITLSRATTIVGALSAATATFTVPDGSATGLTVTSNGRTRQWLASTEVGAKAWYWETAGSGNYGSAAGQIKLINNTDSVTAATISAAGAWTFANGVTVSAGTTAVQILTATTGTFAGGALTSQAVNGSTDATMSLTQSGVGSWVAKMQATTHAYQLLLNTTPIFSIDTSANASFSNTLTVAQSLTVSAGGLTVSAGGLSVLSGATSVQSIAAVSIGITGGELTVNRNFAGAEIARFTDAANQTIYFKAPSPGIMGIYNGTDAQVIAINGVNVSIANGALTISGGLTVNGGGANITGTLNVSGAAIVSSGLTVSAGGLTVNAGGASITGAVSATGSFKAPWTTDNSGVFALDTSAGLANSGVDVISGGQINLGQFSGLVVIQDTALDAAGALFFCAQGVAQIVVQQGTVFSAGYNIASKVSLGPTGGSMFVTNQTGSTRRLNVTAIRTRVSN